MLGRTETRTRDRMYCTVRRYEQLETSPETIEQELRPAVCEHRQTNRLKGEWLWYQKHHLNIFTSVKLSYFSNTKNIETLIILEKLL